MTNKETRPLTVEETASLLRLLDIEIGHANARAALRLIDSMGAGIFMPADHGVAVRQSNHYSVGAQC